MHIDFIENFSMNFFSIISKQYFYVQVHVCIIRKNLNYVLFQKYKHKKVFIHMQLENDWLTTGLMDFEYKKYILLAYDRDYTKNCNEKKIFPHYDDVIEKLKIANEFLNNITFLENSKKEVDFVDLVNKRIVYHSLIKDESM